MAIIAMTGPGGIMTGPGRNDDHFRHCEARSAVAIIAMTGRGRNNAALAYFDLRVRLSKTTGSKPTSTRASAGSAASPRRSSRASW